MGWVLALLVFLWGPSLEGHNLQKGSYEKIGILEVLPTQFTVGFKEIEYQVEKIHKLEAKDEIGDYKYSRPGQVVLGPGGKIYLIDGHHFAYALLEAGHDKMWVEVIKDYSDLSPVAFWAKMREKQYVYLKANGKTKTVSQLPKSITALKNDRFRSLAWMVRKCGGFEGTDTPFQDFEWGDFLRTRIAFRGDSVAAWKRALAEAVAIAQSSISKSLEGWHGGEADCGKILEFLEKD